MYKNFILLIFFIYFNPFLIASKVSMIFFFILAINLIKILTKVKKIEILLTNNYFVSLIYFFNFTYKFSILFSIRTKNKNFS